MYDKHLRGLLILSAVWWAGCATSDAERPADTDAQGSGSGDDGGTDAITTGADGSDGADSTGDGVDDGPDPTGGDEEPGLLDGPTKGGPIAINDLGDTLAVANRSE